MLRATPDIEQDAPISSALDSLRVTLLSQLDTAVQLATAGEWNAVQLRLAIQIPAVIDEDYERAVGCGRYMGL
jgi:hypothetical protein